MSKRDEAQVTIRLTPEEDVWLRRHATKLRMDVSELVRKSLALAVPILMANSFVRKTSLDDVRVDPDCP
jgi:hypothetical protein